MNHWDATDWWVFAGAMLFIILFVSFAAGWPQALWKRADPNNWQVPAEDAFGTPEAGAGRMPPGYHDIEDAYDDGPMALPEPAQRYTFFVNGDPLCIAQWMDTEDGFWEFSNDEPDEMVMLYAPRPGDTLTSEPGEAF